MTGERSGPPTRVKPGAAARARLADHELVAVSGPDAGRSWTLAGAVVSVGHGPDVDVRLSDRAVSRRHAELEEAPGGVLLRDLGSTNGTQVNGMRVREAFLHPGSALELGDTVLRFQARAAAVGEVPLGESPAMHALFARLDAAAATALPVVLVGETGSGKEVLAREIHRRGPRAAAPFVVFDCASTEASLMAAALFGHTAGAFTGATAARAGAFASAHPGTLFIDEVGELPLDLQPKLLRVLESKGVQPIGSDACAKVDVRIVCATHRDLHGMVAGGQFRQDLFYRLSGLTLEIPPLRARGDDIVLLARAFLAGGRPGLALAPAAEDALRRHPWPGNVRELRNVIERSAALAGHALALDARDLVFDRAPAAPAPVDAASVATPRSLEEAERRAVEAALRTAKWNKVEAARMLGITRKTLDAKIEKYALKKP